MNREIILKQMQDAYDMKQKIKADWKLRQIYSDFDFDKFIRNCKIKLGYELENDMKHGNEISGFYVVPDGYEIPWE